MSKAKPINTAASVRQRLLNLARQRNDAFQLVLTRYAIERLLFRLSRSKHSEEFTLKGAMLFQLWTGQPHRSTLDLDLLGSGSDAVAHFENVFRAVFVQLVEEDGLLFMPDSVRGEEIREDQTYRGIRIHGIATLDSARISLQIDIGLGDAVTPDAEKVQYPTLLKMDAPILKAYPKETVVAEKYEAMVSLGITNSRMKDFYDLWVLSGQFEFDGTILAKAIQATFQRRGTALPTAPPVALRRDFAEDGSKRAQWTAFIRRGRLLMNAPPLDEIILLLDSFLTPVTGMIVSGRTVPIHWTAGGPWK